MHIIPNTTQVTLRQHVEQFAGDGTHIHTDEYDNYNTVERTCSTVCHGKNEWTRDDDGNRKVYTNTIEGMWTGLCNFLCPFRGVSKHFLSGYVAVHEFAVNLKRGIVNFILSLVRTHLFYS